MAKFRPGQSGNVKGRPRGVPDRRRALREKIDAHTDELIALALQSARAGDTAALSLLLSRAVGPARPEAAPVTFALPDGSLSEQAKAVLRAVADGQLDPHTGRALVAAVAEVGRVVELDELTRRIEALERGGQDR